MIAGILRCCVLRRVLSSSGTLNPESRNICHTPSKCKNITGIDQTGRKWHIYSAVCVERHPVVQAKMTEMEKRVFDLFNQIDVENSRKSDHELRLETEALGTNKNVKGKVSQMHAQKDTSDGLRAIELEDIWRAEWENFEFPPTYDDTDFRSLDRKLDRNLVLLIQQQFGKTKIFLPPQVTRNPDESMRDTAERCLKTLCGPHFKARIYGNAPFGYVQYSYPRRFRENGYHGAKVFYFLAKYLKGNIPEQARFQWVDREELGYALPNKMSKRIFRFLLPE